MNIDIIFNKTSIHNNDLMKGLGIGLPMILSLGIIGVFILGFSTLDTFAQDSEPTEPVEELAQDTTESVKEKFQQISNDQNSKKLEANTFFLANIDAPLALRISFISVIFSLELYATPIESIKSPLESTISFDFKRKL